MRGSTELGQKVAEEMDRDAEIASLRAELERVKAIGRELLDATRFYQPAEKERAAMLKALSSSATGMVVVPEELLERFIAATCAKLPRDRGAYMNALAELRALLKDSPP